MLSSVTGWREHRVCDFVSSVEKYPLNPPLEKLSLTPDPLKPFRSPPCTAHRSDWLPASPLRPQIGCQTEPSRWVIYTSVLHCCGFGSESLVLLSRQTGIVQAWVICHFRQDLISMPTCCGQPQTSMAVCFQKCRQPAQA